MRLWKGVPKRRDTLYFLQKYVNIMRLATFCQFLSLPQGEKTLAHGIMDKKGIKTEKTQKKAKSFGGFGKKQYFCTRF